MTILILLLTFGLKFLILSFRIQKDKKIFKNIIFIAQY